MAKLQTTDMFGYPLRGRLAIVSNTDDCRSFAVEWDPHSISSKERARLQIEEFRSKLRRMDCWFLDCRIDSHEPLLRHTERWCLSRSVTFCTDTSPAEQ